MRVTTIKTEKSLAELARKVYKIVPGDAPEKIAEAEKALLKANLGLKDFAGVKPGTTVVVPDVEGLKHALPEGVKLKVGPIEADEPLRRSITRLKKSLGDGAVGEKQTVDRTLEALKSPALKVAIKENPELAARVDQISAAAKKRAKEIDEEQSEQAEVFSRLAKDFDEFIETGALVAALKSDTGKPEGSRKSEGGRKIDKGSTTESGGKAEGGTKTGRTKPK